MSRCRCFSRKLEKRCCGPYHGGRLAPTPQALMRSRFAAYAKGLVEYIVATTDPAGSHWREDQEMWRDEIRAFCEGARFEGLTILEAPTPGPERASVSFRATSTCYSWTGCSSPMATRCAG
jgi:SEC-C motif-containing protein